MVILIHWQFLFTYAKHFISDRLPRNIFPQLKKPDSSDVFVASNAVKVMKIYFRIQEKRIIWNEHTTVISSFLIQFTPIKMLDCSNAFLISMIWLWSIKMYHKCVYGKVNFIKLINWLLKGRRLKLINILSLSDRSIWIPQQHIESVCEKNSSVKKFRVIWFTIHRRIQCNVFWFWESIYIC